MSGRFELSATALGDLRDIWHYIGVRNSNPAAADRLWQDIEEACWNLAKKPSLGHVRRDLTPRPEMLFYCVRDHYLVIYRKGTEPLEIVRVLHGARDVRNELRAD